MFQFTRYLTPFLPFQIRDWLAVEEEMLRKQAVVVGDVGEIMEALDKQMVSELSLLFASSMSFHSFVINFHFSYNQISNNRARKANFRNFSYRFPCILSSLSSFNVIERVNVANTGN